MLQLLEAAAVFLRVGELNEDMVSLAEKLNTGLDVIIWRQALLTSCCEFRGCECILSGLELFAGRRPDREQMKNQYQQQSPCCHTECQHKTFSQLIVWTGAESIREVIDISDLQIEILEVWWNIVNGR
jgi:hypothetical protein